MRIQKHTCVKVKKNLTFTFRKIMCHRCVKLPAIWAKKGDLRSLTLFELDLARFV